LLVLVARSFQKSAARRSVTSSADLFLLSFAFEVFGFTAMKQ